MNNKRVNIILVVIFVIAIGLLFLILNKRENDKKVPVDDKIVYKLVNEYNTFFTIENCANKFYNVLSVNDTESINYLLDESYQGDFENKYQDMNVSIKVNEMYYHDNDYYLKGYVYQELINGINKLKQEYMLIKLDDSNDLFSVVPLNEWEYYEVING